MTDTNYRSDYQYTIIRRSIQMKTLQTTVLLMYSNDHNLLGYNTLRVLYQIYNHRGRGDYKSEGEVIIILLRYISRYGETSK